MIVRAILANPHMADDFDYFNDYHDTMTWLRNQPESEACRVAKVFLAQGNLESVPATAPEPDKPDELLTEFVTLEAERLAAEQRVKDIKARTKQIEAVLLDEWADRGQTQVKIKGRTVFIRNDFYCSKKGGVATDDICAQLEKLGLSHMVNPAYAPASLKSLVREMVDEGKEVPKELDELLRYDTTPRLMTRAS